VFIAHLPAGYLLTRRLQRWSDFAPDDDRLLYAGLAASILPDIDLFYFYLLSDRSIQHHAFFPHFPLFWLAVFIVWTTYSRSKAAWAWALVVCSNAVLHIALDPVAGSVRWLAPFSDHATTLREVPPLFSHWAVSMLLDPVFLLECAVVVLAALALSQRPVTMKSPKSQRISERVCGALGVIAVAVVFAGACLVAIYFTQGGPGTGRSHDMAGALGLLFLFLGALQWFWIAPAVYKARMSRRPSLASGMIWGGVLSTAVHFVFVRLRLF